MSPSLFRFIMILGLTVISACASTPVRDEGGVTLEEAKTWLSRYCSKGPRDLSGSLVFKAKTKEFKGQHPGNLRFDPGGGFSLEVTHILGGTLMRLTSDGHTFSIETPTKPKFNRSQETRYLGIELPILRGLLLGDLPCPWPGVNSDPIEVSGSTIRLPSGPWVWIFSRTEIQGKKVPYEVELSPRSGGGSMFVLRIEEWDSEAHFAKKVRLTTPEGELRWIWRSRAP